MALVSESGMACWRMRTPICYTPIHLSNNPSLSLSLIPTEPDRKYFGKVADATPQDTLLLTLGCGKFRFYDHDYGMLPNTGLPRLVSTCALGGGALRCTLCPAAC